MDRERPLTAQPRRPRCDEELSPIPAGRRRGRGWTLVCPELHCDYRWTPTRLELVRMALAPRRDDGGDSITSAAG